MLSKELCRVRETLCCSVFTYDGFVSGLVSRCVSTEFYFRADAILFPYLRNFSSVRTLFFMEDDPVGRGMPRIKNVKGGEEVRPYLLTNIAASGIKAGNAGDAEGGAEWNGLENKRMNPTEPIGIKKEEAFRKAPSPLNRY